MVNAHRYAEEEHERVIRLTPLAAGQRHNSPTGSTFDHDKLLPENLHPLASPFLTESERPILLDAMSSRAESDAASSVFEPAEEAHDRFTDPTQVNSSPDENTNYDLKPPPPSVSLSNAESIAERLFSPDHLNLIMRDPKLSSQFSNFIHQYRSHLVPLLRRYQDIQKAKSAVEYANAIAQNLPPISPTSTVNGPAATLDAKFESRFRKAKEFLTDDALPAFITYNLVQLVTEYLVKEITCSTAPMMRDMVQGLAEVFCMTDPSLPDNPIVYASEEFYRTSQYGREYVIGRNCRFLQGPKTSHSTITRMSQALRSGLDVCETILNYRRDGTPFMNLLMMAPLYDKKGRVRYFIGCQIDVTNLIDGGRGLDSFHQLLTQDRSESRFGALGQKSPLKELAELSRQFSREENDVIRQRSVGTDDSGRTSPTRPGTARRYLGLDGTIEEGMWSSGQLGPSGRLPGVYQNYLLVRPYPSLRITFTSAALRIPGMLQSKLMDRIGGSESVRNGILESLTEGVGVTAKVSWLTHLGVPGSRDSQQSRPRWIHCTPLFGSDQKVGVWMIVMIENESLSGSLNAVPAQRVTSPEPAESRNMGSRPSTARLRSNQERIGSAKLYAQYLRESKAGSDFASERGGTLPSRPTKFTEEGLLEF